MDTSGCCLRWGRFYSFYSAENPIISRGFLLARCLQLLKQQLKIKTFVGTSANAVRIQIWTALIAVLAVRYLQFCWAVSNLVALLRWSLFTYRNLWEWLDRPFETPPVAPDQMELDLDSIRTSG